MNQDDRPAVVDLHEEQVRVGVEREEAGRVRVRKAVDVEQVQHVEERRIEQVDLERLPADAADSGQVETLPDGSLSIPLFEEELVVTKRMVVRERVVVRKQTVIEEQVFEVDLRRERVEVETDEGPARHRG